MSVSEQNIESGAPIAPAPSPEPVPAPAEGLVEQELLVEDVSIDGMCGVY